MRILVTGFEPFAGETLNPAFEALSALPDTIAGAEIIRLRIPTVFETCDAVVEEAIETLAPDVVLCVGQAGGRFDISIERVAINLADGRIPDNAGDQPIDRIIRSSGQNAYFATVPVKAMVERIRSKEIPASVSYSAGTFVCNYIMYCVAHSIATDHPGMRSGFIHVPYMPSQAIGKASNTPTMSIETMVIAISAAIEAIVDTDIDLHTTEGQVC